MSKSQKILSVFGIVELAEAVFFAGSGYAGGGAGAWISMVVSLVACIMLFIAAKDASKALGAWYILLVGLIVSVIALIINLAGEGKGILFAIGGVISVAANVVAFIAVNNVKRQGAKEHPKQQEKKNKK